MKLHMIDDRRIEKELGLAVARRSGLVGLSSTKVPGALFTRALGFGTFVPATQVVVDLARLVQKDPAYAEYQQRYKTTPSGGRAPAI